MNRVWRGWLRVAEKIGTFQMIVILSIIYWVILPLTAVPYMLLADPFGFRRPKGWGRPDNDADRAASMRRQF
jgi:hypothetical protein